jgi:Flp pilus assembly protein TadG
LQRHEMSFDRRGAVSVLFAGAAVPIVGLLGLAIDYTFLNQARTQMALAADTAAISSVRLASSEFVQPVTSWNADATLNGNQWWKVQLGSLHGVTNASGSTYIPAAPNGTTFTSKVSYNGTVPAHFAALFGVPNFYVQGASVATISINAYVNITLMIDNSSSMLIGATANDVNVLQTITACSPESMSSNQGISAWSGPTPAACPTTYTQTTGASYSTAGAVTPPVSGKTPYAAPCGFACHWSTDNQVIPNTTKPDYTRYDYYALANNPAIGAVTGYAAPTLREAVVQAAAVNVVQTMATDEVLSNQFGLAVYTFGNSLVKVYPASTAEAGYDLSTDAGGAQALITAITQPVVSNDGNTDFPDSMNSLASNLTAGGDGSSSGSPKKDVFIVTDGIQDYESGGRQLGPFNNTAAVNACNAMKAKGIGVYVLYTPYTPLPYNPFYVSNIATYINNPPTPNDTIAALQACATSPSDYYEADIPSQITTGLNTLLKAAISTPAKINS